MIPIKIAIAGKMRSGKDTVATELQYLNDFTVYRFADGITSIIEEYFPEDIKWGKPREHYQLIGQSFRELDDNVWIKALHRKRQFAQLFCNELITDARQANEVQYCKDHGFKVIKVVADDAVRMERIKAAGDAFQYAQFYHSTETGVDSLVADYLVDNSGTMENTIAQVKQIYKQILQEETV